MSELEAVKDALLGFDAEKLAKATEASLKKNISPQEIMNVITASLKLIGEKFEKGELLLVHLVASGEAAKRAISEYLEPLLSKEGTVVAKIGTVAIGTVAGDIHDIGKNIVASMFFSAGFKVIDLGKDVSVESFIKAVEQHEPDILGMSTLLSTSLPIQREVVEALNNKKLRETVKIIVGGAPVTPEWAEEIGTDGYAEDALEAVNVGLRLLGKE
ncbi:MAG: cobalamin-dependent protein [Candidatus Bathyarchaeota archaeon]|nr:MAG: cobalamin-dependent protein [Candidatus Bathyarchaeota archaeon]